MFFFLLLSLVCGNSVLNKEIHPQELLTFEETIGPDDQELVIYVHNLGKAEGLRYRLTLPQLGGNESTSSSYLESSEDTVGTPLADVFNNKYTESGYYKIEIMNVSSSTLEVAVGLNKFTKINESNKDLLELRSILTSLQDVMTILSDENYYLKTALLKNLSVAKFNSWMLNLLFVSALLTFAIAYLKFVLARQLVRPKSKRFGSLF